MDISIKLSNPQTKISQKIHNIPICFLQFLPELTQLLILVVLKSSLDTLKPFLKPKTTKTSSFVWWSLFAEFLWNMTSNHDYSCFLSMSLAVTNESKNYSEGMKLFFRTFAKFLVPGMIFHKMLTSLNIRQFRLFLLILAISQEFLMFQCPLKSVDVCWHRRYKKCLAKSPK